MYRTNYSQQHIIQKLKHMAVLKGFRLSMGTLNCDMEFLSRLFPPEIRELAILSTRAFVKSDSADNFYGYSQQMYNAYRENDGEDPLGEIFFMLRTHEGSLAAMISLQISNLDELDLEDPDITIFIPELCVNPLFQHNSDSSLRLGTLLIQVASFF